MVWGQHDHSRFHAGGDLTAFTTYIVQILMSLMMLAMVFLNSSRALASIKRINEVLDTVIDLTDDALSQSGIFPCGFSLL